MKKMNMAIVRTSYLRICTDLLLESKETVRIVIECRKYKIPPTYAMKDNLNDTSIVDIIKNYYQEDYKYRYNKCILDLIVMMIKCLKFANK